jgi:lipopolysaccharide/colanic/teichoic acid biosynthesis glycosyltransferase
MSIINTITLESRSRTQTVNPLYKTLKRGMDLVSGIFALLILSPIFILVIIILSFTGEHEVFYLQKRLGYKNRFFYIWKFATMLKNSPNLGTGEITVRNDPRVTPVGKILRLTKINELPQIINVLKGNMSIVGPRPLLHVSFKLYDPEVQKVIYNSKPGITGIGSLIFRDEEKLISTTDDPKKMYASIYPYKGALEMWYQKHASFYTDCMIIFLTAWLILFPSSKLVTKLFKDLPEKPEWLTFH